jgi:integrase
MTELEFETRARLLDAPGDAFALATPLPLAQHPAEVYLARLAPGSRRTMRGALNTLASALGVPAVFEQDAAGQQREVTYRFCRWEQLRYQHTAALRSRLAEQYTAATANKILAALRGVLKEAWQLGFMTSEDYHRARNVQNIKDTTLLRGRALKPGESIAIQAACADDDRLAAVRDAALLAVMQGAGLRRSEVVALDLQDYDREAGVLWVRRGKGNKDRRVPVASSAVPTLEEWLAERGTWAGPLFCRTRKGNTVVREPLSAQAVYKTVQRRATAAHVPEITPHDLRRTFISNLLDAGVDLSTSSELAGHSDPRTTKRYDRRGEATRKQAVDKLHVPYVPRRKR